MSATQPTIDPIALLEAALGYAARGWHVIPLRAGEKRPAFPDHPSERCDGRDPRCRAGHVGWQARATTDPDRITRAWSPTSATGTRSAAPFGIGIACGPSGLVVVDLDVPKPDSDGLPAGLPVGWRLPGVLDGADVLCVLAERAGVPAPLATRTVRTPTGGTHLYFAAPPGLRLGNTAKALGPLVDTRGHGGQVVAPPTTTTAGAYVLLADVPPAPLPPWLARALQPAPAPTATVGAVVAPGGERWPGSDVVAHPRAYALAALDAERGHVLAAAAGARNHALYTAAVALGQIVAGGGLDDEHVRAVLTEAAAVHVAAGAYTAGEGAATITSGLRRGATQPRGNPNRQAGAA